MEKIGVLFVCMGNICRSPVAEGVFRHLVEARGWSDRFDIDSAGTSSYHEGDPPDSRSTATARRRGITLTGRSRPFKAHDLDRFAYILVMDAENLAAAHRIAARAKGSNQVRLLREFDPQAKGDLDVPDPYYGGPRGFEDVHEMIERACSALLEYIARTQQWPIFHAR